MAMPQQEPSMATPPTPSKPEDRPTRDPDVLEARMRHRASLERLHGALRSAGAAVDRELAALERETAPR